MSSVMMCNIFFPVLFPLFFLHAQFEQPCVCVCLCVCVCVCVCVCALLTYAAATTLQSIQIFFPLNFSPKKKQKYHSVPGASVCSGASLLLPLELSQTNRSAAGVS